MEFGSPKCVGCCKSYSLLRQPIFNMLLCRCYGIAALGIIKEGQQWIAASDLKTDSFIRLYLVLCKINNLIKTIELLLAELMGYNDHSSAAD